MNSKNSEPGTKLWIEEYLPRVEKERKPSLRENWENAWENAFRGRQIDNVPRETHVISPMTRYLEAGVRVEREKAGRLLQYPT